MTLAATTGDVWENIVPELVLMFIAVGQMPRDGFANLCPLLQVDQRLACTG